MVIFRFQKISSKLAKLLVTVAFAFLVLGFISSLAFAVPGVKSNSAVDSLDASSNSDDDKKDFETLLDESRAMFVSDRPIDARSKLLKALKLKPEDYRPYLGLSEYYLSKVAHFELAYRYAKTAEEKFEKQYGSDKAGTLDNSVWQEHARLLYVLSEAQLNFDRYQDSLETLERFAARYWDTWLPGTMAWVQMKLKKIDDAVLTAQKGLLRGADPGRTFNILGILFSVKGNRELSLTAFSRAIQAEFKEGGNAQAATPLNNAGEVYRELFRDEFAEAAWKKALEFPDGCDHILPSLNLATLYIDELRLFQAERALSDFEACFKERSIRADTEHRALIALSRGRIALHRGDADTALELLQQASDRRQWFGKIGTNESDVRFAATNALALALDAKVSALRDTKYDTVFLALRDKLSITWLELRSYWLKRRARQIAIEELDDFEDLFIRNTDAMIEYPTLGQSLAGFPTISLERRVNRMIDKDARTNAHAYYRLYLAINYLEHSEPEAAMKLIDLAEPTYRDYDRLIRAETTAGKIVALQEQLSFFGSNKEIKTKIAKLETELFSLAPSFVRARNFSLPVAVALNAKSEKSELSREVLDDLLSVRFYQPSADMLQPKYLLSISSSGANNQEEITVNLVDKSSNEVVAWHKQVIESSADIAELVNKFIAKCFSHRVDPSSRPLPALPILKGVI
jgi:hypothetical protein